MRIGIDASRAFVKERTGTEEYSYQLITHLMQLPEAKEHEWILYVKDSSFKNQDSIKNWTLNIEHWTLKQIRLPYLWTQVGLAYRTWVDKLDVLWIPAHTLPILRQPSWLRRGKPLYTVVTIHGIEYEWLPQFENWLQKWYLPLSTQYAVMSASRIIAVSEFTKRQLVERLHADPEKIEVVHEGVGIQGSRFKVQDSIKILNKYNLQKKKYILFIGTVQPRKNLVRLIQAFSMLNTQYSMLKLVIVGKLGWNYQEVLDEIPNSSIKRQIVIAGYIDKIDRDILLHNALVYVQPSITEGFGLPALEAFAAGIPVVSSNGGALPEIAQIENVDLQMTNLFDPYDVTEMQTKILEVIENQRWRKYLIKEGLRRVRGFSWKKAAIETYNIFINSYSK